MSLIGFNLGMLERPRATGTGGLGQTTQSTLKTFYSAQKAQNAVFAPKTHSLTLYVDHSLSDFVYFTKKIWERKVNTVRVA